MKKTLYRLSLLILSLLAFLNSLEKNPVPMAAASEGKGRGSP